MRLMGGISDASSLMDPPIIVAALRHGKPEENDDFIFMIMETLGTEGGWPCATIPPDMGREWHDVADFAMVWASPTRSTEFGPPKQGVKGAPALSRSPAWRRPASFRKLPHA